MLHADMELSPHADMIGAVLMSVGHREGFLNGK
jgi:hypothetical protein